MDTTPSDLPAPPTPEPAPPAPPPIEEQRLHSFSWLFVLITRLRPFVLPALILLLFGRGNTWELWGAVGAGALALYSVIYSIGFRYRLSADELLIREGIFDRTERHIPYARIQNIVLKRNVLHRIFGVAELRLESAGGKEPEAIMSVITLDAAARLEQVLRGHGTMEPYAAPLMDDDHGLLLRLNNAEVARLGLVTNRGMVVVGAALAFYWQAVPSDLKIGRMVFGAMSNWMGGWHGGLSQTVGMLASVAVMAIIMFAALKVLSMVMAFITFHDFRLRLDGARVNTVGGLLTRHAASARVDKIQRVLLSETWLARKLGRRALACDVAGGARTSNDDDDGKRLKWLAPIARPADIAQIAAQLCPGLDVDAREWKSLHPRAWRRVLKEYVIVDAIISTMSIWLLGWWSVALFAGLCGWGVLAARGWARFAGYAWQDGVLAFRAGWLTRHWVLTRVSKGQVVALKQSPFDRRANMASVTLDSAGAQQGGFDLRIPYLDREQARALFAEVSAAVSAATREDLPGARPALAAPQTLEPAVAGNNAAEPAQN
jgi:putative membrane protein